MLIQDRDVFVLIPDGSRERVLHQGLVLEVSPQSFVARLTDPITPVVGTKVFAHGEVNRKFMQQAATITAYLEGNPNPVLAFSRDAEPISAESRNTYRVSVAAANLTAVVGEDADCRFLDVSATGFGVSSHTPLEMGDVIGVRVAYQNESCAGPARVQSVRALDGSMFRYGLHAVEARRGSVKNELQIGLSRISAAVQRDQLRRLARA